MAKVIISFRFSRRFKKEYKKLPNEIQGAFDQKLLLFLQNMSHPSLGVKKIQATSDRWEGSITMRYRFTFQMFQDSVIFRAIGTYDILNRESQQH
jgi:mRNA interferase RelE/StbE